MKPTIRVIHRYLGFFLMGIISVYAISGIVLSYRGTNIFRIEKTIEKTLEPGLSSNNLSNELNIRRLNIDSIASNKIYFKQGFYDELTGETKYTEFVYPDIIQRMHRLHMTSSRSPIVWFTTFFGIALLFLAISSMWMYKSKSRIFKKGIIVTLAGLIFTILVLYL